MGKASRIMVNDGPLRQPLMDYLLQTGRNEHYDARGTENPEAVTGNGRSLEFTHTPYSAGDRIEAMKHATQQAEVRRRCSSQPTQVSGQKLASSHRIASVITR